eukprot:6788341-Pyramimonas_sp.AAC.1
MAVRVRASGGNRRPMAGREQGGSIRPMAGRVSACGAVKPRAASVSEVTSEAATMAAETCGNGRTCSLWLRGRLRRACAAGGHSVTRNTQPDRSGSVGGP